MGALRGASDSSNKISLWIQPPEDFNEGKGKEKDRKKERERERERERESEAERDSLTVTSSPATRHSQQVTKEVRSGEAIKEVAVTRLFVSCNFSRAD